MLDEQWMIQFLEKVRAESKESGAHTLYRILPNPTLKFDTLRLPPVGARNPLIGLSHVPMAAVVYVQYQPGDVGINFRAFVFWPNKTHAALFGTDGGAIEAVPGGATNFPKVYLTLSRIAWGTPLLPNAHASANWVILASMKDFVDEVTGSGLPDSDSTYWQADEVLRLSIAKHIAALRRAANPHATVAVEGQDEWYKLLEFGEFLGQLDWSHLDPTTLATELGHSDDSAHWWTSQGIGCLEQVDLPSGQQCLSVLKVDYPQVESNLWSRLGAFEQAVIEHYVSPSDRLRTRWQTDDPLNLVNLTREVVANNPNTQGPVLVGYSRTESGPLQRVSQATLDYAANSIGLDFTSVGDIGPSDGILLIASNADGWMAHAANRAGEHGTASSTVDEDADQFACPVDNPEVLAALRKTLTGRASFEATCTPFEWARRHIMFGVASGLEKLPMDRLPTDQMIGAFDTVLAEFDMSDDDQHGSTTIEKIIDLTIALHTANHLKLLLSAANPADSQPKADVLDFQRSDGIRWTELAGGLDRFRELQWDALRAETMAEAWAIPVEEAQWWQTEGLVVRHAQYIPDETESMIRSATVIAQLTEDPAATSHLRQRLEKLFGDDMPVLWSLVP